MSEKKRKKFIPYKCESCDRCMVECAVRHSESKNLFEALNEKPAPMPRLSVTIKDGLPHMAICQKCGKPRCRAACEFKAIHEHHDGNVVIDRNKCVGCWACVDACPFGAIFKNKEKRISVNCDNCKGYPDLGCVTACPTNAIVSDEEPLNVEMCRI